jgi:fibronectin-binding autotransporter adhesin
MTNTITMTGNSTGYGAATGAEVFSLSGYYNSVLLAGASDTLAIAGGEFDSIDLNASGFTSATTDSISLGQSAFNTITTSHDLYGSSVSITGGSGPNQVSLVNHGGNTSVQLGYQGSPLTQAGVVPPNSVTLNGDATNSIGFSGGAASVSVGQAGDGFSGYTTALALSGVLNHVFGGDEAFSISGTASLSSISLGNGNDTVALAGNQNTISLGTGNNTLTLPGNNDSVMLAKGGAGSTDVIYRAGAGSKITGGDENVTIAGTRSSVGNISLGNGNDVLNVSGGGGHAVFGSSIANTATDQATVGSGNANLTFNGGVDTVLMQDFHGHEGADTVTLNGTMLGTSLTTMGVFDNIVLTQDANATITDGHVNGALSLSIEGDGTGGMGTVSVTGLATDDMAHLHLVGLSAYTVTPDNTPAGGVTLHFTHGSIDLIGVQVIPNNFFG